MRSKLRPWYKAIALVGTVSILWLTLGSICSEMDCIPSWLAEFIPYEKLLNILTILAALQIPVLIFLLDRILKTKFLLRKILPMTIYLRETIFLLITVNLLVYMSPNLSYALLPFILAVLFSFRTMYISLNVATRPEDYMQRGYIKKITQQIASEDMTHKTTTQLIGTPYERLSNQLHDFHEILGEISDGLREYLQQSNIHEYEELLNELYNIGNQIDGVYALAATKMNEKQLLYMSNELRSFYAESDSVHLIIKDQQAAIMKQGACDFAELIMHTAYGHLRLYSGLNNSLAGLIRYNEIMMGWLKDSDWSIEGNTKAPTENYSKILKGLLWYLEKYPRDLQNKLRYPSGRFNEASVINFKVFLSDVLMRDLHLATHNILLQAKFPKNIALKFLNVIVELQNNFREFYDPREWNRAKDYVKAMRYGFVMVAYALKSNKDMKQQYRDFIKIFFIYDWKTLVRLTVEFDHQHHDSDYKGIARQLFIENILRLKTLGSIDVAQLSIKDKKLLQGTTFFSRHIDTGRQNTFFKYPGVPRSLKQDPNFKRACNLVNQLAQIRIDHETLEPRRQNR